MNFVLAMHLTMTCPMMKLNFISVANRFPALRELLWRMSSWDVGSKNINVRNTC
jgi:hypothetical protein